MTRPLHNSTNSGSRTGGHSSRNDDWQTLYGGPSDMYDHVPFRGTSRGSMRGRRGVGRGNYDPRTSVHRRHAPQQSSSEDVSDQDDGSDDEDSNDGDSDDEGGDDEDSDDDREEEDEDDDSSSDNGESTSLWNICVFPG